MWFRNHDHRMVSSAGLDAHDSRFPIQFASWRSQPYRTERHRAPPEEEEV